MLSTFLASSVMIMGIRVSMLAAKFLLTLFIARFMGLEEVGLYGLIVGASGTVQAIFRMGVFQTLSRDAIHQPQETLVRNLRYYGTGIVSLYAFLACAGFMAGLYFGKPEIALLAILVFLTEHFAFDIFILINNQQKPRIANLLLSLQSASWIYVYVVAAFFIPSLRNLETILFFWIIGGFLTIGFAAWLSRSWEWKKIFAEKFDFNWYKNNIHTSWKLYIGDIVTVMTIYVDRFLISAFLGLELAGVYVMFAQIENAIVNLVTSGVIQVYGPKLVLAYKEKNHALFVSVFKKSAIKTLLTTAGLAVIAAIAMPYLIRFTDKPLALEYIPLYWLMLLALFPRLGAVTARGILSARYMDSQTLTVSVMALALTVVGGWLCLYYIGIYGILCSSLVVSLAIILIVMLFWQ